MNMYIVNTRDWIVAVFMLHRGKYVAVFDFSSFFPVSFSCM